MEGQRLVLGSDNGRLCDPSATHGDGQAARRRVLPLALVRPRLTTLGRVTSSFELYGSGTERDPADVGIMMFPSVVKGDEQTAPDRRPHRGRGRGRHLVSHL